MPWVCYRRRNQWLRLTIPYHTATTCETTHWGRVPSVRRTCYPALAWPINLQAYAMPSVPVPPITLLTDMVPRSRLLAAHGLTSCLSVRTQPLTATGAPSQTSTMPCHAMPWGEQCRHLANHPLNQGSGSTAIPRKPWTWTTTALLKPRNHGPWTELN